MRRRTRWDTNYVAAQRQVFVDVWRIHIRAQLDALNGSLAPDFRRIADIKDVSPMRAAALFAWAWMRAPERLAQPVDPEPESTANRAAVSTILFLSSGELTGLHAE